MTSDEQGRPQLQRQVDVQSLLGRADEISARSQKQKHAHLAMRNSTGARPPPVMLNIDGDAEKKSAFHSFLFSGRSELTRKTA